jgi:hypothetical protein
LAVLDDLQRKGLLVSWTFVNNYGGCKICGKPDWCRVGRNSKGELMYACKRRTEGAIKINPNGSGLYKMEELTNLVIPSREKDTKASIKIRDKVYSEMLNRLTLFDIDKESLLSRGFTKKEIEFLTYKSVGKIANSLYISGFDLTQVPGFYKLAGEWCMNSSEGFFIPARDRKGYIQGLQIRTRTGKSKYKWFSSRGYYSKSRQTYIKYDCGASSGSPAHFRDGNGENLWITESLLKTDVTWLRMDFPHLVGMGGTKAAHEDAIERAKCIDIRQIVIAFDVEDNKFVNKDIDNLYHKLIKETGKPTKIAVWDEVKGIDDALFAGKKIEIISYEDWIKQ